ncbi:hypothetical protein [Calidithermus timidus]|jgi:hypothetical protein|uniref:hypothetical protein n=1 Tax=Calidithermus timidus TaxID=307124 RepID=UPI0003650645|nr:hypothetical protein [Calidithermus timidus]
MRKLWLAFPLALLLAACTITIDISQGRIPGLYVKILGYETEYKDSKGGSYICDNTFTTGRYNFRFEGDLDRWESVFVGQTTGERSTVSTYVYGDNTYVEDPPGYIQVNFAFGPGAAPYLVSGQQMSKIVVVPTPNIIGYTQLELTFYNSAGNSGKVLLKGIPVIDNCPNP